MFSKTKKSLLNKPRRQKRLLLLALDSLLIPFIVWAGFSLRLNTPFVPQSREWLIFPLAIVIAIPVFVRLGLYRAKDRCQVLSFAINSSIIN